MRKEFSAAIEKVMQEDESIIFLTGDLGYNALENLKERFGNRFINAGVAEQNMVGVAAGMAYKGHKVFCYSIAPFVVYRCLEQFRNDVCLHNLSVFLVGNGGGYGYGIMGSTHHAIEDIGCLSGLQNVKTWIPAFSNEVDYAVSQMVEEKKPAYLRLGVGGICPENSILSQSLKKVTAAQNLKTLVICLGPIVNNVFGAIEKGCLQNQVSVYTALHLPLLLSTKTIAELKSFENIVVVEEHVGVGGLGQQLSVQLLANQIHPKKFVSLFAKGYPSGLYGSQKYHQAQSGLDIDSILEVIRF